MSGIISSNNTDSEDGGKSVNASADISYPVCVWCDGGNDDDDCAPRGML